MSVPAPNSVPSAVRRRRRRSWLRRIGPLLLLPGGAVAGIAGILWWHERPLRQAEALLVSDVANGPAEALKIVDEWLLSNGERGAGQALKARILVRMGDPAQALRILQQVGADQPEEMQAWTEACLLLERWTSALPVLEHLVRLQPDNPDLLHQLSACRAKLGRYDEAVEAARRFAALPACEARGHALIGMLERDRANYQKCVEAWDRLFRIQPDAVGLQVTPAELFLEYGKALLQLGRSEDAVRALSKSESLQPSADAAAFLGKAFAGTGRQSQAQSAWKSAVQLNPESRIAREGLAELALQNARFDEALQWLTPLENSPSLRSSTAFLLQRTYTLLRQPQQAERWKARIVGLKREEDARIQMEQVIFTSPDSLWGQVFQAWHLAEQNNPEQARTILFPFVRDDSHPFIKNLWTALDQGSAIPGLKDVPMDVH
ncbi:MAG: tetratricopeptide repeat protein [Planctomycetota bacterium]